VNIGLPAIPGFAGGSWRLERTVLTAESPFGKSKQRVEFDGYAWRCALRCPPYDDDDAAVLEAWLDQVSRGDSSLYLCPPQNTLRGSWQPAEQVINGTFIASATTGWIAEAGTTLSVNARRLKVKATGAGAAAFYQDISTEAGKPHILICDVQNGTVSNGDGNGFFGVAVYDSTGAILEQFGFALSDGRLALLFYPSGTTSRLRHNARTTASGQYAYLSNVSVCRCLTVSGGGQTGNVLIVDGGPANTNAALKVGQFVSLRVKNRWQMVRLTEDFDTDSAGAGTLRFEPALRDVPIDGEPVLVRNPFVRMNLAESASEAQLDAPKHRGFAVDAIEDSNEISGEIQDDLIWAWDAENLTLAPQVGSGTPTIARASATATHTNSSGLTATVAANTARFDYDPVTLAIKGLLIEVARTNVLLRSSELDNATWIKNEVTVSANALTGPDGTASMDNLIPSTNNTDHYAYQAVTIANSTTYACAFDATANGYDYLRIMLTGPGGNSAYRIFNLLTGALGATSGATGGFTLVSSSIRRVGTGPFGGIYRCAIVVAADGGAAGAGNLFAAVESGDAVVAFAGVGGSAGIGISDGQVEIGAFPTSYIPTTTAAVTRNADDVSALLSSISGFNATQGSMVAEFIPSHQNLAAICDLNDGGTNEQIRMIVGDAGPVNHLLRDGGVVQANYNTANFITPNVVNRCAIGWKTADSAAALNGGVVATDASGTIPAPTTFQIGEGDGGVFYLNGHIRKLRLYRRRLPNQMLKALSA
jgi:hypothetical protein